MEEEARLYVDVRVRAATETRISGLCNIDLARACMQSATDMLSYELTQPDPEDESTLFLGIVHQMSNAVVALHRGVAGMPAAEVALLQAAAGLLELVRAIPDVPDNVEENRLRLDSITQLKVEASRLNSETKAEAIRVLVTVHKAGSVIYSLWHRLLRSALVQDGLCDRVEELLNSMKSLVEVTKGVIKVLNCG